jgi:hypothetical protein
MVSLACLLRFEQSEQLASLGCGGGLAANPGQYLAQLQGQGFQHPTGQLGNRVGPMAGELETGDHLLAVQDRQDDDGAQTLFPNGRRQVLRVEVAEAIARLAGVRDRAEADIARGIVRVAATYSLERPP